MPRINAQHDGVGLCHLTQEVKTDNPRTDADNKSPPAQNAHDEQGARQAEREQWFALTAQQQIRPVDRTIDFYGSWPLLLLFGHGSNQGATDAKQNAHELSGQRDEGNGQDDQDGAARKLRQFATEYKGRARNGEGN